MDPRYVLWGKKKDKDYINQMGHSDYNRDLRTLDQKTLAFERFADYSFLHHNRARAVRWLFEKVAEKLAPRFDKAEFRRMIYDDNSFDVKQYSMVKPYGGDEDNEAFYFPVDMNVKPALLLPYGLTLLEINIDDMIVESDDHGPQASHVGISIKEKKTDKNDVGHVFYGDVTTLKPTKAMPPSRKKEKLGGINNNIYREGDKWEINMKKILKPSILWDLNITMPLLHAVQDNLYYSSDDDGKKQYNIVKTYETTLFG